jgi:hypothetical protein
LTGTEFSSCKVRYRQIGLRKNIVTPLAVAGRMRYTVIRARFWWQGNLGAGFFSVVLHERPENPDEADAYCRNTYPKPPHRPDRAFFGKIIPV